MIFGNMAQHYQMWWLLLPKQIPKQFPSSSQAVPNQFSSSSSSSQADPKLLKRLDRHPGLLPRFSRWSWRPRRSWMIKAGVMAQKRGPAVCYMCVAFWMADDSGWFLWCFLWCFLMMVSQSLIIMINDVCVFLIQPYLLFAGCFSYLIGRAFRF